MNLINEVFNVMEHFPGSRINGRGELILSDIGNVYIDAGSAADEKDLKRKLLEYTSRDMAKGMPYRSELHNEIWRKYLICGLNEYLETSFTEEDMLLIYDRLGNGINHRLTNTFVESGYDMEVLR